MANCSVFPILSFPQVLFFFASGTISWKFFQTLKCLCILFLSHEFTLEILFSILFRGVCFSVIQQARCFPSLFTFASHFALRHVVSSLRCVSALLCRVRETLQSKFKSE